jgi:hypothetical protein
LILRRTPIDTERLVQYGFGYRPNVGLCFRVAALMADSVASLYLIGRETYGKVFAWRIQPGSAGLTKEVSHVCLNSPDGFELGTFLPGSADLAASLLADFLGVAPNVVEVVWKHGFTETLIGIGLEDVRSAERVIRLHSKVRDKLLAPIRLQPNECVGLDATRIGNFLQVAETETPKPEKSHAKAAFSLPSWLLPLVAIFVLLWLFFGQYLKK